MSSAVKNIANREPHALTSITHLRLLNFRNYRDLDLSFSGSAVITGVNGAGKTNILEAISLLSPGRGLRNAKLTDLIHRTNNADIQPWSILSDLSAPHGTHRIGTGADPGNPIAPRRVIQIDGKPASQTDLSDYCAIAWLTPAMDRLFVESPSARRKFLDRLVYAFYPNHLTEIQILEKAQRERGRILQFGRIDQDWINALEAQMAKASVKISAYRADYIRQIAAHIADFGGFPALRVDLISKIWVDIQESGPEQAEARLTARLFQARERDRFAGSTRESATRDDFTAFHLGKNRHAGDCSTGEQKMAVISILLAHCRLLIDQRGKGPILLLDELAAHLDAPHRTALAGIIQDLGVQAFISGSDAGLFGDWQEQADFFAVKNGQIEA